MTTHYSWRSTLIIRVSIVCLWIVLIYFFLYMPRLINSIYTQKQITILTWPAFIDAQYVQKFEKETGIKVNIRYFDSNEELYVKMKKTGGEGYDLIIPSDYILDTLIQEDLLKKIDRTKLHFFDQLYPHLVGTYVDPHNDYSIPYWWGLWGMAFDKSFFGDKKMDESWALIFNKNGLGTHTISLDDGRELILIAAQYLFGNVDVLDEKQLEMIRTLLIDQKPWVEVYAEVDRANFLLASKICPIGIMVDSIIARVMLEMPDIRFIMPKEGGFLQIDSFAIPKTTTHEKEIYQFLNFIYSVPAMQYHTSKFGFFSPVKNVQHADCPIAFPTEEQIQKTRFFKNIISREQISDIWIALKS